MPPRKPIDRKLPVCIGLTAAVLRRLDALARRSGTSRSALVNRAVADLLVKEAPR